MAGPAPAPAIPDADLRKIIECMRTYADDWGRPSHMRGADPAFLAERRMQARRIHAFAEALLHEEAGVEDARRPEVIVFLHCVVRRASAAFAAAMADYAREYLGIERSDLDGARTHTRVRQLTFLTRATAAR